MRATWSQWIQGRVQQLFSTEFILTVTYMVGIYVVIMADKMTTTVAGAIAAAMGPVMNYCWQRTRQKANGGQ